MRKENGLLHFFVNGIDQGTAASNVPEKVYGVIGELLLLFFYVFKNALIVSFFVCLKIFMGKQLRHQSLRLMIMAHPTLYIPVFPIPLFTGWLSS